ncbi:hypothetical protein BH23PLA1_BH23PLA1_04350 [soil metagenome]
MTSRRNRYRWWLTLAYCLSVVLAQGIHSHGDHNAVASHQGDSPCPSDCGEPANGDDVFLSEEAVNCDPGDCPSCQFQLNHQAALPVSDCLAVSEPRVSPAVHQGIACSTPSSRPHNRGPPLA